YKERDLRKIANDIIPVNQAKVGEWYKGAQCKDGLEMVYLGNFYQKTVGYKSYSSYYRNDPPTFHLCKNSPKRVFFACKEGKKWDIISFSETNKKIKDVIKLYKTEDVFKDKDYNRKIILFQNNFINRENDKYHNPEKSSIELKYYVKEFEFLNLNERTYCTGEANYISDSKENIDLKAYLYVNQYFNCVLDKRFIDKRGYRSHILKNEKVNVDDIN
ncbi:hypothetical protein KY334_02760, partial [Candidatus Woesearchaeota archaeon]|nr:hypothetical protein [Candidatus Woesearchaeota archaeon]